MAFFSTPTTVFTLLLPLLIQTVWVDFLLEIIPLPEKISEVITCDFSNWAPDSGVSRVRSPLLLSPLPPVSQSHLWLCWYDWQDHQLWLLEAIEWKDWAEYIPKTTKGTICYLWFSFLQLEVINQKRIRSSSFHIWLMIESHRIFSQI